MNDAKRTGLIAIAQSIFPVINLILGRVGARQFTADEVSIIWILISNAITFTFLFFKEGQQPADTSTAAKALAQSKKES